MGANLLHRHEWYIAFLLFLLAFSYRLEQVVKSERRRTRGDDELYKNAHQVAMVKEWVTSQYCKSDLEILCPTAFPSGRCHAAFDPPLRFVLDLPFAADLQAPADCSLKVLLSAVNWAEQENINELEDREQLTYLIAHVLDQLRAKSTKYFRADDHSVQDFEQSKLIENALTSIVHMFSSPTRVDKQGRTVSTKATDVDMTTRVWSREEVIASMHEACLWHTHHKRHGSSTVAGAALRLSRQQPSFVFKFLPLVKEQIQNLEDDPAAEARFKILYPSTMFGSESFSLAQDDNPRTDACLWSHFDQGTLITQDCTLALETAPGKIRELDWEGTYLLLLVRLYTFLTVAFVLWSVSRLRQQHHNTLKRRKSDLIEITPTGVEVLSASVVTQRDTPDFAYGDTRLERIRKTKRNLVVYLCLSCLVALAASGTSETIRFGDFLDGVCVVLLGVLSLNCIGLPSHPTHATSCSDVDKRQRVGHYKKQSSLDIT